MVSFSALAVQRRPVTKWNLIHVAARMRGDGQAPGTPPPEDKECFNRKATVDVVLSHALGAATRFRAERAAAHAQSTCIHVHGRCRPHVDHA